MALFDFLVYTVWYICASWLFSADSGFVPIFTYAFFGSSRQLAIGPVALVSLLVSNGLAPLVDQDNEVDNDQYTRLAILLALMVGLLEVFMGLIRYYFVLDRKSIWQSSKFKNSLEGLHLYEYLVSIWLVHKSRVIWTREVLYCRLGWLIRFISHSIISGFTTGSAIIIGLSQVKNFLGYEVTGSSKFIPLVQSIIAGRSQVSCSNQSRFPMRERTAGLQHQHFVEYGVDDLYMFLKRWLEICVDENLILSWWLFRSSSGSRSPWVVPFSRFF